MKLIVFTDGGRNIGFGHLSRCIAIAEAFKVNEIDAEFYINGDNSVEVFLQNKFYKLVNWYDENRINNYPIENNIILIDSYIPEKLFYERVKKNAALTIAIDDAYRLDYNVDVVLNGSIGARLLNYHEAKNTEYWLGVKYQALRKEFWNIEKVNIKRNIRSILIMYGGTDVRNLSNITIDYLKRINENFQVAVLLGNRVKIEENHNIRKVCKLSAFELKEMLFQTDLVISAAGQSLYEFARMGVPAIAIKIIDNQSTNIAGWLHKSFIEYIGDWKEFTFNSLQNGMNKLDSYEERKKRNIEGPKIVDGQGAMLISNKVLSLIN